MAERIVVCFRERASAARPHDDASWLDPVRFLLKRAEALGATVCSWERTSFSLAFLADDLEELIDFLIAEEVRSLLASFSVGISQGDLTPLVEFRGSVELGRGPSITRALALARLGTAGEVLVDADMQAVRRGDLLTLGSKLTQAGSKRIRGHRLDVAQPWRVAAERALENLKEPAVLFGREVKSLPQVAAGTLAIVRAEAGVGGSRFVREWAAADGARVFLVQPAGFCGEPLGALRRAVARDVARNGKRNLRKSEQAIIDSLLHGTGAQSSAVAEALEEWISSPTAKAPAVVIIDDANEIDASSLDAIAASMLGATKPFRCLARLDALSPLPAQLAPLPPGPEVELQPLQREEGEQLAAAWLQRPVGPWASEWASRGAGFPLALGEALAEALSTGELVWTPNAVQARARAGSHGKALSARAWIARRWRLLDSQERSLLFAVAVLGGDASRGLIQALLQAAADASVDLNTSAALLMRRGWLLEPEPGWLAFPTRTQAQVVLEFLPDTRQVSWHRAASLVIEAREGELARAEAGRQASLAQDLRRAARLYGEAARAASRAQLETAAPELSALARAEELRLGEQSQSAWPMREQVTETFGSQSAGFVAALLSRSPQYTRSSYPPVEALALADNRAEEPIQAKVVIDVSSPAKVPEKEGKSVEAKLPAAKAPEAKPQEAKPIEAKPLEAKPVEAKPLEAKPVEAKPLEAKPIEAKPLEAKPVEAKPQEAKPVEGQQNKPMLAAVSAAPRRVPRAPRVEGTPSVPVVEIPVELPQVAREAYSSGDFTELVKWAEREPKTEQRDRLVSRLRAMVSLEKGDRGEAIRILREACSRAQESSVLERSRSHLALALGLAQTGRPLESLVEALEALARARDAEDARAEKACVAFLQKLYKATGHTEHVKGWESRQ